MGLVNLITVSTCFNATSWEPSLVDHFYTNDANLYIQHGTIQTDQSDHHMIYGSRKQFRIKRSKNFLKCRKYKNLDENKLHQELLDHNRNLVLNENDPDICWENFVSGL